MRTFWKSLLVLIAAASVTGAAPAQRVHTVVLSETTTEREVRAAWGEPTERRGDWVRYPDAPGGETHLMYSRVAPHRLIYAYRYGAVPGRRAGERIVAAHEQIAMREVGQIDPCATEAGAVVPIWGWPNYEGNAAERYYFIANGELVRLGAGHAMRGIDVLRARDRKLIRRIAPRDCPERAPVPAPSRSWRDDRPDSIDPFAPPRLLSDLPLAAGTTAAQVEAIWGDPRNTGFGWETYRLASGERVGLLFSPVAPFDLVYAYLYPAGEGPGRRVFSNNVRAASRSLDQVGLCPRFARTLWDLWGPPDWEVASGFFRAVYVMSNGDEVTFISPGDPYGMRILRPSGEEERIECPRAPEPSR